MKNLTLFFLMILMGATITRAQVKVGIKASGSIEAQRVNVRQGSIYSGDNFRSYSAGLIAETNLFGNFYLQPQLLYSRKGATLLSTAANHDARVRINYIEMPVNLLYKFDVTFGNVYAGAGAAIGYAISGRQKQGGSSAGIFSKGNHDWKREDISLGFTAGVQFDNGLFASINSQKGLADINKSAGVSVKNKAMSVSVGYMIDWSKFKRKA